MAAADASPEVGFGRGLHFQIVTIFPDFFTSIFRYGVVGRAFAQERARVSTVDLRSFTIDKHRTVDDRPFGGGEGMVMKPEPLARAIESLGITTKAERDTSRETVVLLSAQGRRFTQKTAHTLSKLEKVVINWVQELQEQEESAQGQDENDFTVHARALQSS